MHRVLITGATGFVGMHLGRLLAAGDAFELYGTARRAPERVPAETWLRGDSVAVGDLTDADFAERTVRDIAPEWVVHLAAQASVADAWRDPTGTIVNNLTGQANVLQAVRRFVPDARVLVAGSSEEYGRLRPEDLPATEDAPLRPDSPYAVSKIAQDYLGLQYFIGCGISVVRARSFNLLGPGQSDRFAVSSFARQIIEVELGMREPFVAVGNLTAKRDLTDVRDAVRAYRALLERAEPGEVYNVGGGGVWVVQDVLARLIELSGQSVEIRIDPNRYRPVDTPEVSGNFARIRGAIGWQPEIPLDQTLMDILAGWREALRPR